MRSGLYVHVKVQKVRHKDLLNNYIVIILSNIMAT